MKAQDLIAPRMIEDEEIDDEAMRKEKAEPNPIVQRLLKMREVLKQAAIHAKLNFPPLLPGEGNTPHPRKVREIASRSIGVDALLDFFAELGTPEKMPHFDPHVSTTRDVVRQVVIPATREASGARCG